MKLKSYDLDHYEQRSIASPGICIYCTEPLPPNELTDEHVIPFALGHNTLVFKKASCKPCAEIIQRYEQDVLSKQLGNFRLQVDAPSRTKRKNRPTTIEIPFVEVDDYGTPIRELGVRSFAVDDAPLVLNLWWLPEPRLIRDSGSSRDDAGGPWSFTEPRANEINRKVAEETGVNHVAMKVGEVNRSHFLRFLAKTAHAYAVAELGMDGFTPFLNDIIRNKAHDLSQYVGGTLPLSDDKIGPAGTVVMSIGGKDDLVAVLFQVYPSLKSPAYAIIVGERNANTDARIEAMRIHYD